mgnify:CR=1 FL=1
MKEGRAVNEPPSLGGYPRKRPEKVDHLTPRASNGGRAEWLAQIV